MLIGALRNHKEFKYRVAFSVSSEPVNQCINIEIGKLKPPWWSSCSRVYYMFANRGEERTKGNGPKTQRRQMFISSYLGKGQPFVHAHAALSDLSISTHWPAWLRRNVFEARTENSSSSAWNMRAHKRGRSLNRKAEFRGRPPLCHESKRVPWTLIRNMNLQSCKTPSDPIEKTPSCFHFPGELQS